MNVLYFIREEYTRNNKFLCVVHLEISAKCVLFTVEQDRDGAWVYVAKGVLPGEQPPDTIFSIHSPEHMPGEAFELATQTFQRICDGGAPQLDSESTVPSIMGYRMLEMSGSRTAYEVKCANHKLHLITVNYADGGGVDLHSGSCCAVEMVDSTMRSKSPILVDRSLSKVAWDLCQWHLPAEGQRINVTIETFHAYRTNAIHWVTPAIESKPPEPPALTVAEDVKAEMPWDKVELETHPPYVVISYLGRAENVDHDDILARCSDALHRGFCFSVTEYEVSEGRRLTDLVLYDPDVFTAEGELVE
jgi:hypothetical protein